MFVISLKIAFIMMYKTVTDQMGNTVKLPMQPKRIVSLVPSQTELLYHLGLADEIVGQTLFCIHPAQMHQTKPRVGGTKNVHFDKVAALNPDLIIGNKEENTQQDIEVLKQHYPVWMSNINTLTDALNMINEIGMLVNKTQEAEKLTTQITNSFDGLNDSTLKGKTVLYLIWQKPWMAAGTDTFIHDMLSRQGLKNVVEQMRYLQLTNAEILHLSPELIFLSSEPFPFKQKHIQALQLVCPNANIILVDGELFSWYGSRLLHSVGYFKQLAQQINF